MKKLKDEAILGNMIAGEAKWVKVPCRDQTVMEDYFHKQNTCLRDSDQWGRWSHLHSRYRAELI